jgi:hypothetical protein
MVAAPGIVAELDAKGFAIVEGVLGEDETLHLLAAIERLADIGSKLQRRGEVFAVRNLLDVVPDIAKLATSYKLRALLEPILGNQFVPVRGILFDKVPEANWKVPWHQDVTIAPPSLSICFLCASTLIRAPRPTGHCA